MYTPRSYYHILCVRIAVRRFGLVLIFGACARRDVSRKNLPSRLVCVRVCVCLRVCVCVRRGENRADFTLSEKPENHTHTPLRTLFHYKQMSRGNILPSRPLCCVLVCVCVRIIANSRGNVVHYIIIIIIVLHFILPRAALRRVCLHTAWSADTRLLRLTIVVVIGAMPPSINILYGVFAVSRIAHARDIIIVSADKY